MLILLVVVDHCLLTSITSTSLHQTPSWMSQLRLTGVIILSRMKGELFFFASVVARLQTSWVSRTDTGQSRCDLQSTPSVATS